MHVPGIDAALTLRQLQRKMEERRLRLQEAANRCVPFRWSQPRPQSSWEDWGVHPDARGPAPSFLPRRFCSQVALTPEEREQRALYAAILEYEQDHVSSRGRCLGGATGGGSGWGSLGPGLPSSPPRGAQGPMGLMALDFHCTPG